MTRTLATGAFAKIGGSIAAIVLLAGSSGARADELADLRANQELLQKRIDQLSQAPPPGAPGPYVPGFGPETRPAAAPVTTGSFPRSFLIPGTDTSLRIGGIAWTDAIVWFKGARQGGALNGQGGNPNANQSGLGGTGDLASIPLNGTPGHSRSSAFDITSRPSRLLFDARTPTAWGEVKAYLEMDFAATSETFQSGTTTVTNGWIPRLRKAYATMGGLLAGQEQGMFHDPDADPELLDFGGEASTAGRARVPQVKYTYQGPYGLVLTGGFENPDAEGVLNPAGKISFDNAALATTSCSVTANTTTGTPATTACVPNSAFLNPLKVSWPELIGTARINQPWGHLGAGVYVRNDQLNDGQYLDQKYVGYGGRVSGDVHPFSGTPGPLGKDDLGFGLSKGVESGGQIPNGLGVASNFGSTLFVPGFGFVNPLQSAAWNMTNSPTRKAYDAVVRSQSPNSGSAWLWYQHWWTENLRSTLEASGLWNTVNTNLVAGSNFNKFLSTTHANLIWSPVAFVDFGIEYAWGHRQTGANAKGDAYTLQGSMRVRF